MFAHEFITIANPGLHNERVIFTGDNEYFLTLKAAQASADRMNKRFPGLDLEVFKTHSVD